MNLLQSRRQGFSLPKEPRIATGGFYRFAFALLAFSLALAACSPFQFDTQAAEPDPTRPTATFHETQPTIEPSPTAETLPASLEANREALKKLGYELRNGDRGWELISPQGDMVLSATDTLTVTAYGADNEVIISPEQAFAVTKTIGAGMEQLLTLNNAEGKPTHTFLERAGYWAPLAEIQTDPREIENYPEVPIEAIWNGLLAQSEALTAEPFPAGTFVPEKFIYVMWGGSQSYSIQLQDFGGGLADDDRRYHVEAVNKDNDYRRWTNFYRSQTPEGVEVIIGTEQILMPDGKTSLFFHYVFGPEISWEKDFNYAGRLQNLIDSVFLSRTLPAERGRDSMVMRPQIFTARWDDGSQFGGTFTGQPKAAISLYNLPHNNPATIKNGLEQTFRQFAETNSRGTVATAGDEVEKLQYMGLGSDVIQAIFSAYFNTP